MAVAHFNRPPPRDEFERIVRETHTRLDKLLKHTHLRISGIYADSYTSSQKVLKP